MRRRSAWLAAALVLTAVATWLVTESWLVPPADENKSQFLREFDPSAVMKQFVDARGSLSTQEASAGSRQPGQRRDVLHKKELDWQIRSRPSVYHTLLATLYANVNESLHRAHASVTHEDVEVGRFTISYHSGRTTGWVRVAAPKAIVGTSPAMDKLSVRIEENWAVR